MKATKRILALLLCLTIFLSFISCAGVGGQKTRPADAPPDVVEFDETQTDATSSESNPVTETIPVETEPEESPAPSQTEEPDSSEPTGLSKAQKNAAAMFNFLALIAEEINASDNGQLFLETANLVTSHIKGNLLDSDAQEMIQKLIDTIKRNQLREKKRDLINDLYERERAKSIWRVIAHTAQDSGGVHSTDVVGISTAVGLAIIDFAASGYTYSTDSESAYLLDGWELNEDAINAFYECRNSVFGYRISVIKKYDLANDYLVTQDLIQRFVEWEHKENINQKIQHFEAEQEVYQYFGPYWLELTKCYFEKEEYEKCLEALQQYQNLEIEIFSRDDYYAKALPSAIAAASHVLEGDEYIHFAEKALIELRNNIEHKQGDWALQFFAAEAYVDLYQRTDNLEFLRIAFEIVKNNVNILAGGQETLRKAYLQDVSEIPGPSNESAEAEELRVAYNKKLKENREKRIAANL